MSIFAFALYSLITYIVVSDFRDKTKPVVSVNRVKLKAPLGINFYDHGVFSSIGGIHIDFLVPEQLKKYITIRGQMVTTTKDNQGNYVDKIEAIEHALVDDLKSEEMKKLAIQGLTQIPGDLDYYVLFKDKSIFLDLKYKDMYVTGSKFSLPFRRLRYKIYPCSLPNPTDCASFKDLSEFIFPNIGMVRVANYSKKIKPLVNVGDVETMIPLTIAETLIMSTYLKENFIYDEDMDIFGERGLTYSFVDVDKVKTVSKTRLNPTTHCSEAQIESGACEPYIEIVWRSSFDKLVIERRYTTLLEVISEIGGFCDLISYGILAIYFYYNTRSYTKFIRCQLVDGYLELDQKRLLENKTRPVREVKRIKSQLMKMKFESENEGAKSEKLSFKKVFKTKVDLRRLVELSFKSEVMILAMVKNKAIFSSLASKIIYEQKKDQIIEQKGLTLSFEKKPIKKERQSIRKKPIQPPRSINSRQKKSIDQKSGEKQNGKRDKIGGEGIDLAPIDELDESFGGGSDAQRLEGHLNKNRFFEKIYVKKEKKDSSGRKELGNSDNNNRRKSFLDFRKFKGGSRRKNSIILNSKKLSFKSNLLGFGGRQDKDKSAKN